MDSVLADARLDDKGAGVTIIVEGAVNRRASCELFEFDGLPLGGDDDHVGWDGRSGDSRGVELGTSRVGLIGVLPLLDQFGKEWFIDATVENLGLGTGGTEEEASRINGFAITGKPEN